MAKRQFFGGFFGQPGNPQMGGYQQGYPQMGSFQQYRSSKMNKPNGKRNK